MKFETYTEALKAHWGAALASAVVPAACWTTGLCPPWPDSGGNAACAIAALVAVVGVLLPFTFSRNEARRLASAIAGALAVTCLVVYVTCWSTWVAEAAQTTGVEHRMATTNVVKGTRLAISLDQKSEDDVLRLHGWRVDEVYTPDSLVMSRLALLLSFSGIFFFLTLAFGFLAAHGSEAQHEAAQVQRKRSRQ